MNEKILKDIQLDIRKNFNKRNDWFWWKIASTHFNCYMYAVSNTIPTEVVDYMYDGEPFLRSVDYNNGNNFFFANIGQISGKAEFHNTEQLKKALEADLNVLGIELKECSLYEKLDKEYKRIAFFYDLESLERYGTHQNFHLIKQRGKEWYHKTGWNGKIEKLEKPIEEFKEDGLQLVGYFRIKLK